MECHEASLFLVVVIGVEYGAGPGPFVFVFIRITPVLKVENKYSIFCDFCECCIHLGVGVLFKVGMLVKECSYCP